MSILFSSALMNYSIKHGNRDVCCLCTTCIYQIRKMEWFECIILGSTDGNNDGMLVTELSMSCKVPFLKTNCLYEKSKTLSCKCIWFCNIFGQNVTYVCGFIVCWYRFYDQVLCPDWSAYWISCCLFGVHNIHNVYRVFHRSVLVGLVTTVFATCTYHHH